MLYNVTLFSDSDSDAVHNLTGGCNADCHCSRENYNPVCGADSVLYFSPCHAGCKGKGLSKPGQGKV